MQKNNWHNLKVSDIVKILNSNTETGLSEKEALLKQSKFGKNKLPEEKPLSQFKIFLSQFKSEIVYILLIAGFITLFISYLHKDRYYIDSVFIFIIVFLASIIGFIQEKKTAKTLYELKKVIKNTATVFRERNYKIVDSEELVPGDIIVLSPGSKIPADARIIECHNLKVNEAVLTGEWLSIRKKTDILPIETPLADRDNMVFMGTTVEEGKGKGLVVQTGINTEIGKISETLRSIREEKTAYQKKVIRFTRFLGIIILLLSFFIFILGILRGTPAVEMFLVTVAMAVAAIPEGLPAAITLVFTFGMREILKKKGLVRKLIAAETLGSTSIIATDKTGTLTEGKMEIASVFVVEKYNHDFILKAAALCSEAFIENFNHPTEKWIVRGRPTDKALVLGAIHSGINLKELQEAEKKIDEIPFDSNNKYSAVLCRKINGQKVVYLTGAPEIVFEKSIIKNMSEIIKKNQELTYQGYRTLAVSYKEISNKKEELANDDIKEMNFIGLIALHDPIRKRAKEAINICRLAGIRPIIITGDHKLTTKIIAQQIGFNVSENNILEGKDLDKISDRDFKKIFKNIQIYTRVTPEQKLRIISAWQEEGQIIAMTGDGINDAPALKKANIGIALGSGTEVAKEAADLVLLTDDFEVILVAVEEGRRIIDNIRKIVTYLLTGAFTEIMLVGAAMISRLPLPVLATQILWKNLIQSTPPSLALTFEPKEKDIMLRKPEPANLPLLTKEMNIMIFVVGIFTNFLLFLIFWLMWNHPDYGPKKIDLIRSVMFAGLAIDSFFFIFSFRNLKINIWQYNPFSNIYINISALFGFLFLLAAIYLAPFQIILKTAPFGIKEWVILIIYGLIDVVLIEFTKFYYRKKKKVLNN